MTSGDGTTAGIECEIAVGTERAGNGIVTKATETGREALVALTAGAGARTTLAAGVVDALTVV